MDNNSQSVSITHRLLGSVKVVGEKLADRVGRIHQPVDHNVSHMDAFWPTNEKQVDESQQTYIGHLITSDSSEWQVSQPGSQPGSQ